MERGGGAKKSTTPSSFLPKFTFQKVSSVYMYLLFVVYMPYFGSTYINSFSASLLLNIFLSFEVGIAHAIANFKWKKNTSSLKN